MCFPGRRSGKTVTPKQKRFCEEYLVDLNATQAAVRAGYSEKTAKQAGSENLSKPDLKACIEEQLARIQSERIADAAEVMEYLTRVMRGEETEEVVAVEGQGDGVSRAALIVKNLSGKDRLKAAELLGKRYSLFTDKVAVDSTAAVQIIDDLSGQAGQTGLPDHAEK